MVSVSGGSQHADSGQSTDGEQHAGEQHAHQDANQYVNDNRFVELREALASRTGTHARDWFPVFKARYGMQIVFEAMHNVRGNGSVMTQLFTCCTAVDPIIVAGLRPRYADVDANTMAINPKRAESLRVDADEQIHAVMLQHTFGAIDAEASRALAAFAEGINALLVEDCAHCAARMAVSNSGEPLADISVHSFGVEKILPTRFGGAVWVNPRLRSREPALHEAILRKFSSLAEPSKHMDMVTKMYVNENRVLSRLGSLGITLRASLTKSGWYEPPIAEIERRGGLASTPMTVTPWIASQAEQAIRSLDANEAGRRDVVEAYRRAFVGCAHVTIPHTVANGQAQPLLRFPLFAQDTAAAERIIAAVRAVGGYAERWYRPELFPGVTDPAAYGLDHLDRSSVTVSDHLVATALCLPTELGTGDTARARVQAIIDAVLHTA